jgi:hypothetical protein
MLDMSGSMIGTYPELRARPRSPEVLMRTLAALFVIHGTATACGG